MAGLLGVSGVLCEACGERRAEIRAESAHPSGGSVGYCIECLDVAGGTNRPPVIVVVDDLPANVRLLQRVLDDEHLGEVHAVTDSRDAVARCADLHPDLVLLDLHMPHLDGIEILEALRSALAEDGFVPVIVLTADATPVARDRALSAGATDFLTKPFERTEVALRVRNLLQARGLHRRMCRHNALLRAALDRRVADERRLEGRVRAANARVDSVMQSSDALRMVFQPIVELASGRVVGAEALARFRDRHGRRPDEWFVEAAEIGRGEQLELLAVERALQQMESLDPDTFLSINVSPATAMGAGLRQRLREYPGSRVVLELTEHEMIDDYEALWPAFDELRAQGVRIAVDDAGAGFAGLQHILRLRPDIVKLDSDLTFGVEDDPARHALAVALVGFANDFGAVLVAEGIETERACDTLREIGVAWGQGYLLGRPTDVPFARCPEALG